MTAFPRNGDNNSFGFGCLCEWRPMNNICKIDWFVWEFVGVLPF